MNGGLRGRVGELSQLLRGGSYPKQSFDRLTLARRPPNRFDCTYVLLVRENSPVIWFCLSMKQIRQYAIFWWCTSLSDLTPIIFYMALTDLVSEASI